MKKLILALVATATTATAFAQADTPSAYVGVGIATANRYYNVPSGATNTSDDGYRASGKLFGGYQFDKQWGMEGGYTDFRSSSNSFTVNNTATTVSNSGHAWYLAGTATAPINDQFSLIGKLGVTQVKAETAGLSDNKTGAYGALGVQYALNKNVAFTAEYERYGKNNDFGPKPNVWTVAAKYSF
jgi:OOP family OmpA-OmpF porin